jgi:hypothetical protein
MARMAKTGALGIRRERWEETLRARPCFLRDASPGERAFDRFMQRRDGFSHVGYVVASLRVSRKRLLEATEGQPFRRDFGRGRQGPIVVFMDKGLLRWALGQGRTMSTRRARPRPAIARAA